MTPDLQNELETLRSDLDRVDVRLVEILAERFAVIARAARLKAETPLGIRDRRREEEILGRLAEAADSAGVPRHLVADLYRRILEESVRSQEGRILAGGDRPLRIGYLGGPGAYREEAARRHFGARDQTLEPVGHDSFRTMIDAVDRGSVDAAMLPIENTTAGSINEAYDLLAASSLSIVGEEVLPIEHCLIGLEPVPVESLRRIASHPQALAQCSEFLASLDGCLVESFVDTALAVRRVREEGDPRQGAIAGEGAARRYGLVVLRRDIGNLEANFTRFVVVSRTPVAVDPRIPAKTSLLFTTPHERGALARCLDILARHDSNLTKLESRPVPNAPWVYRFYADVEGNVADETTRRALAELAEATTSLRIFGSYPARAGIRDRRAPGSHPP